MHTLQVLKTRDVASPQRGTKDSSGIDFFIPNDLTINDIKFTPLEDPIGTKSIINNTIYIHPGEGVIIPTGIKTIIHPKFDLVFENKSGISVKKHLIIGAKVIDSDYRGEVHIHLINTSNHVKSVKLGDKVAQAILRHVILDDVTLISNEEFGEYCDTERGEGGFGSTGDK